MRRRRRREESGFALLLVILMAAVIAISLYKELPRVAFDAQREKEQLLIDRANQYRRGIQLFMKTNNRWPTKVEDLESFNNRRFLRKRFTDPMTGKDEWRWIHISNGVLIDSVLNKNKNGQQQASSQSSLVAEYAMTSATDTSSTTPGVNMANRRRASDSAGPGLGDTPPGMAQPPVDPNNPNAQQQNPNGQQLPNGQQAYPGMPVIPGQTQIAGQQQFPGQINPATGQPYPVVPGQQQFPGQQQYPGQIPGQVPGQINPATGQPYPVVPGQQPFPGQQQVPGQQQFPGQVAPPFQYPGMPGAPVNSQFGGVSPTQTYPYPTTPGANGTPPGFAQPGMNPAGNNTAQNMIQQILTSPRPGGMPGNDPGSMQNSVGVGIAGIASLADQEGIKLINDRSNYKEWEFIFDPRRVTNPPNPLTGAPGTSAAALGSMPGSQPGTPVQPVSPNGVTPLDPFNMTGGGNGPPVGFGPVQQGPNGGPVVK